MKRFLCLIIVLLSANSGFAQIDKILAPLHDSDIARRETPLVASLDPQAAPQPAKNGNGGIHWMQSSDLLQRLRKQISDYYSLKGELKLDLARALQPVKLTGNDYDVVITDFPGEGIGSSFFIRCKIVSDGATVAEWQVALRAQLWQEVWGALSRLDRGQALDRTLVALQKVDVLRDKQAFLPVDVDPGHYDMIQSVAAGRPLAKNDVVARPVIRKGQIVEVVVQHGLLKVRMKALALEDGATNDSIKMRNVESRKEFNAQIINEDKVEVQF